MSVRIRLAVSDVREAGEWYARVFDGEIEADGASVSLGAERTLVVLAPGTASSDTRTPVLELRVEDLQQWVNGALAAGAVLVTPPSMMDYAQLRDPWGYIWALTTR